MSALTRDRDDAMRDRPKASDSGWQWPDRLEVTPPSVPAGRPVRSSTLPSASRWPIDMPDRSWPPLPESERPSRHEVKAEAQDAQEQGRFDQDLIEPAFESGGASRAANLAWQQVDAYDRAPGASIPPSVSRHPASPQPSYAGPQVLAGQGSASLASMTMDWTIPQPAEPASRAHDPSPSRLAYRLNRLWLTPQIRHFVRFGLPVLLIAAFAGGWIAKAENRAALESWATGLVETVQNQPMFQVTSIEVVSRSPEVAQGVESLLGLRFPVSSWDLDLSELRTQAEALDAVEGAWLQVRSGGVLEVQITERVPAMVWREGSDLFLVDAEGHRVARLATRMARADLPLIVGADAPSAIAEAEALWAAAAPIQGRIRGLVRVGQRRWDVVLDRDQRVLLPEIGALEALERVVAMTESAQQLLSLDVTVVDMRNPARPTLRLSEGAMTELQRNRSQNTGAPRR